MSKQFGTLVNVSATEMWREVGPNLIVGPMRGKLTLTNAFLKGQTPRSTRVEHGAHTYVVFVEGDPETYRGE